MKLKTGLLAGTSLLAMTAHANALSALGSGIISAFLSVGLGGLLPAASAAAIGAGALALAGTALNLASQFIGRGGQQSHVDPTELKNTSKGTEGPGNYAFGRVELGGSVAFGNTNGYFISRLLLHCFGPLDAIEEYLYDGRSITVDPNGDVSSPPWATPGGSNMNIQYRVGNGTEVAWPSLISDFPGIWTSNHRVRGIFQSLLRVENPGTGDVRFPILLQGGIKELRSVARIGKFYDPRNASTVWTLNGVLITLHWLRILPFVTDDILDFTDIGTVATQAEVSVATLTGTAPRCQLSGGWKGPLTQEIVGDMLTSAGLDIRTQADGTYTLEFVEDNPDSEITLYNRHIIDRDIQAGPEGAKRPNVCRLFYFSPERRYSLSEIDLSGAAWARVEDEITAYGDQEMEIRLPFCCDASQAQRIARQLFHSARADAGTIRTTWAGMACWGLRTGTIELPDVGEDGASVFVKCRLGSVRPNDEEGTCEIPVQIIPEILQTPWNPATDEVAPPPVLELLEYTAALAKPTGNGIYLVQYPGGAYETRFDYSLPGGGTTTEATYRTYSGATPGTWTSMTEVAYGTYAYVAGGTVGAVRDCRVRHFDADGGGSYWSDTLNATLAISNTAPAMPTVTSSLGIGSFMGVTVSTITAVSMKLWRRHKPSSSDPYGAWGQVGATQNVRPGQLLNFVDPSPPTLDTVGEKVNYQIIAYTTDGTAGTPFDTESEYIAP